MAKAKKTTKTAAERRSYEELLPSKPPVKRPAKAEFKKGEPAKAAGTKKPEKKPAKKFEPKLLKPIPAPERARTLHKITDPKDGLVKFLMPFTMHEIMTNNQDHLTSLVTRDLNLDDTWAIGTVVPQFHDLQAKKNRLTLLISCSVKPKPPAPPPAPKLDDFSDEDDADGSEGSTHLETPTTPHVDPTPPVDPLADLVLTVSGDLVSDDDMRSAVFDATPWFLQASDEEILDLAKANFGHFDGKGIAKEVVLLAPDTPDLREYLAYVKERSQESAVSVSKEQAVAWIGHYRSYLVDQVNAAVADAIAASAM